MKWRPIDIAVIHDFIDIFKLIVRYIPNLQIDLNQQSNGFNLVTLACES